MSALFSVISCYLTHCCIHYEQDKMWKLIRLDTQKIHHMLICYTPMFSQVVLVLQNMLKSVLLQHHVLLRYHIGTCFNKQPWRTITQLKGQRDWAR